MTKPLEELVNLYIAPLHEDHSPHVIQLIKEAYLTAYAHSTWMKEMEIEAKYWRATRRDLKIVATICTAVGIAIGQL